GPPKPNQRPPSPNWAPPRPNWAPQDPTGPPQDPTGPPQAPTEPPRDPPAPSPWWLSPDSSFSKQILRPGRGLDRPAWGSRCRVLLEPPPGGDPMPGGGRWLTLRLGTAEGRWAVALDACLETMTRGERARLLPTGAESAVVVTLGGFTPPQDFWEAEGDRWAAVLARKARAKASTAPARSSPPPKLSPPPSAPPPPPGGRRRCPRPSPPQSRPPRRAGPVPVEAGLPAEAAANAGKALALRPGHVKARYRRALAKAAMRDLEGAAADLALVLRQEPGNAAARRELRRVRGEARERDARLARGLGRLFA
ncbi:LOW QUALITY PROTEIN: FK506-binding protein-like, partial [Anas acuta]|uniref:LOW QUALITY PROTEIN: FK506-binding protein-like n=1 Tax=Anas acuta TaxID=28680 RepID=UPI0035C8D238